jgi:hypothetical protein
MDYGNQHAGGGIRHVVRRFRYKHFVLQEGEMYKKQNRSALLVVFAILLLSVLVVGCQKAGEKMVETASGGKAKVEGDKVTIKTGQGTMEVGGKQVWPSRIPADVPKFTYGKIVSVMENNNPKGTNVFVGIEEITRADFDKYASALADAGWKAVTESKSEDGFFVTAKKGNNMLVVSFSGKGDKGFSGGVSYTEAK